MDDTSEIEVGDAEDGVDAWVDRYGDALYRFAYLRLREESLAEDLVQETFLAAISGKREFRNQATVSTWLFAILKRKVADHFRRLQRTADRSQESADCGGVDTASNRWGDDPAALYEDREFLQTFDNCVEKLPNKLSEVFILRELNQHSPKEIREMLGLTATNLSMRLHRSRLAMRDCLNQNWFHEDE